MSVLHCLNTGICPRQVFISPYRSRTILSGKLHRALGVYYSLDFMQGGFYFLCICTHNYKF